MIAIVCEWGGDLAVGPSGDIAVAPVQAEAQLRIVRRLLTNPGEYIWHVHYGAGMGKYVGEPSSPSVIENDVLNQLQYENIIVASPSPSILVGQSLDGVFSATSVNIQYQVVGASEGISVVLNLGI